MPTQDDFDSTYPPAFLLADRMEQQEVEDTADKAARSSRVFKAIALIAAATAIGAAVLSVEDPMALAPTRPGHGISFDWKGLAQLAP